MSNTKIALTGTIGSGKTTVCNYLRNAGYEVFISDEYNSYLLQKGNDGYNDIILNFDLLDENGFIDKKKLADIVFNDPTKLRLLESFTTSRIVNRIKELLKENKTDFYEIPLLFELNLQSLFDYVIVVTADDDIRIERLIKRGLSASDAKRRIKNQLSDLRKIELADIVIYNNGDLKNLYDKINEIIQEF